MGGRGWGGDGGVFWGRAAFGDFFFYLPGERQLYLEAGLRF